MSRNDNSAVRATEPETEIERLKARLAEAEAVIDAIRAGEVDAVLVSKSGTERVLELQGAEHDYRLLVETMGEGAMTLTAGGLIYFVNRRLAKMLETQRETLIGSALSEHIAPADQRVYQAWLDTPLPRPRRRLELRLRSTRGAEVPCNLSLAELPADDKQGAFCAVATDLSEQKHAEARIAAAERLARSILEQAAEAIVVCDTRAQVVRVSEVAQTFCSRDPVGQHLDHAFPLRGHDDQPLPLHELVAQGVSTHVDASVICNGTRHNLAVGLGPLRDSDGALVGSVVSLTDVTRRQQAEDALRENEQRLQTILEHLPVGVWFLDQHGKIIYGNNTALQLWGGAHFDGPVHFDDYTNSPFSAERDTERTMASRGAAARAIQQGHTTLDEELEIKCFDGTHKVILNSAVPIQDGDGRITGAVVLDQDITERKAAENQIEQLAFFDALTQLPNRRLLLDRLGQVAASIKRDRHHGALLFIDLDRFKDLNDSQGHEIGDLLLKQVAGRLRACVRARDTVARLGGDEFVVVLDELSPDADRAAAQARAVAIKIQQVLTQPYRLGTHLHRTSPSIGATLIDVQDGVVDDLLKRADLAMYQAKDAGRNTLRFFDPQMQTALDRRTAMEAQLHDGLRLGEFLLHYQPQVDTAGTLIGAEALLRWQHPGHGLLGPDIFIGLAEQSGLIQPLGSWVMQAACTQLAAWSRHEGGARCKVAVNISARQFRDPGFVAMVRAALRASGVDAQLLTLELTESLLLEDIEGAIARMAELRTLGLRFSLDDFGTGYSSLAYLKRLPLDELKIDRSFVHDVTRDPNDAAIVRAILALAPKLGLSVIAEGVETEEQRRFLTDNGCDAFQGYLFGRPGPPEALRTARLASADT